MPLYRVVYSDAAGRRFTKFVPAKDIEAAKDAVKEHAATGWTVFIRVHAVAECPES